MQISKIATSVSLAAGLFVAAGNVNAENVSIKLEPYVTGVNAPLAMVQPEGDDRKFVIEQFGRVRIINADGELEPAPFLDIRNHIVTARNSGGITRTWLLSSPFQNQIRTLLIPTVCALSLQWIGHSLITTVTG